MRVVAGTFGGRTLKTPRNKDTRPSSSLIRGAIFNSLVSQGILEGAHVADLFAGSGALGIEALSRGAAHVVFVEQDRQAADTIKANLDSLGLEAEGVVRCTTVERWAAATRESLDIVLADPPYKWSGWDQLLDALIGFPPLTVVAESDREIFHGRWHIAGSRQHGGTVVTQLRPERPQRARGAKGAQGAPGS